MPITNSSDPLLPGESLFRDCELGLDKEIIDYILESHFLQVVLGGEPFYLYQRMSSGSVVNGTISSWDQTSPQYVKTMWSPGNSNHPDLRSYTNDGSGSFSLFESGSPLVRVFDKNDLLYDNEYALEEIVGVGVSTRKQIKLYLNSEYIPSGVITYSYKVLCECVDYSTNQPDMNCEICYGAGFPVGWVKYNCVATKYNPTDTILVRVPKTDFRIILNKEGLVEQQKNRHWTLTVPYIKDYDIIAGTIGDNIGKVYEIVNKTDSYLRGIFLHQEFETILLEKSDVRYKRVFTL